jgi:DNA-binding Lrp family transcriptional regulator
LPLSYWTSQTKENTVAPKQISGRRGYVLASWLEHPDVDASAFAVLAALATYADQNGLCWPHPKTIAEKLKKSRPWVLAVLNRLVAFGLIERRPRRVNAREGAWEFVLVGYTAQVPGDETEGAAPVSHRADNPGCQPADTEQDQPFLESSLQDAGAPESEFRQETEAAQGVLIEPTWTPTAADMTFAAVRRPDLAPADLGLMTEKFLLTYRGQRLANVSGRWRKWLLTERIIHGRYDRHDRRPDDTAARSGTDTLVARNDAAARAALDRILARRAHTAPAGCA